MDFKIELSLDESAIKKIHEMAVESAELVMEEVLTQVKSAEVMPHDVGTMEDEETETMIFSTEQVIEVGIVSDVPYARRLYYHPEYNFQTAKNDFPQGLWLEDWADGGSKNIAVKELYESELRKRLK